MRKCSMCGKTYPEDRMQAHLMADHQVSLLTYLFNPEAIDQLAPKVEEEETG